MAALQGVAILVTRPEQQAAPLCELLVSEGAVVIRLPALQIKALDDAQVLPSSARPADSFDLIIFTSANAVHFGAALLMQQSTASLAAIGPATARALRQHGLTATVTPPQGFDSEHLLLHPRLQQAAGQRILIIKGRHGRGALREQLALRGAHVVVAEVYERLRTEYSSEQLSILTTRFAAGGVDIITATSVDVATALLELATPRLRREFERVHWLVPGARVAQAVRALGLAAPLISADSADDHALVAALLRWRSSVSDA